MNAGRTIFSQLMDFLPRDELHQCVQRYDGNHKIKTFSCLDQYLCMAFAQLTGRVVFQMDQTTSANQAVLRHHRQCRQDTSLLP